MNFLKSKKKVILILLIIAVIAGAFAIYQYTGPKEVTNYDVEFETDQKSRKMKARPAVWRKESRSPAMSLLPSRQGQQMYLWN